MQREEKEKNMKANDNNGNGIDSIEEGNSDRQNKTIWLLSLLSPPLLSPFSLLPSLLPPSLI